MSNLLNVFSAKAVLLKERVKGFLKDERSARGTVEEGYLTYAVVVLGIIVLGIVVVWMSGGFKSIGQFFTDGIVGNNTNPNGWGTKAP